MPRVSFTAAEPGNFEPVPASRYHVRIDDAKWEQSKSSGNQQLRVVMCILDEGTYFERQVSEWITHTEATGWKFGQLAEAALDDGEFDKTESGNKDAKGRPTYNYDFDTDDLPGCEMMVQASVEEDQKGNPRNRFRFIPQKREVAAEETKADAPEEAKAAPEDTKEPAAEGTEAPAEGDEPKAPARRRRLQA
jgi:hypothetical protein